MAISFLSAIELSAGADFARTQALNMRLQNLGSAPSSPSAGLIYFDSSTGFARVYSGSDWADLTGSATTATTASLLSGSRTINGTVFNNAGNIVVTASASTLTGNTLNSGVTLSSLTALGAQAQALDMNSQKITGLADGTAGGDAVNLGQLQSVQAGLNVKGSVRAATTANITLSGAQTIDGVSVVAGERVLVKNQTTGSQNGIYVAASGAWSRSADADTSAEVTSGCFVFVSEGSLAATGWVLITADIVLGTTSISFTQFNSASAVVAGNGISMSGSTVSAVGTANRISVSGSGIDISSTYVGQASITTLGTVTTGVWTGTTIALANGGTNATTAAGARTNLVAVTRFAATLTGNSATADFTVTHNFNTRDVIVSVVQSATPYAVVMTDVVATTADAIHVVFATAPATGTNYRVVVAALSA